jgi:hypothetical protein
MNSPWFEISVLFKTFVFLGLPLWLGMFCLRKPEIVFRFIVIWLHRVLRDNDFCNQKIEEAFKDIDNPRQYYAKFPAVITAFQISGWVTLLVGIIGSLVWISL